MTTKKPIKKAPVSQIADHIYSVAGIRISWIDDQTGYVAGYKFSLDYGEIKFYSPGLGWEIIEVSREQEIQYKKIIRETSPIFMATKVVFSSKNLREGEIFGREFWLQNGTWQMLKNGTWQMLTNSCNIISDSSSPNNRYFKAVIKAFNRAGGAAKSAESGFKSYQQALKEGRESEAEEMEREARASLQSA